MWLIIPALAITAFVLATVVMRLAGALWPLLKGGN